MFITQTNDFGSVIWKIEQHICQIFDVETFWYITKLVPSKDHFNNKKHYKCTNVNLKQKITIF